MNFDIGGSIRQTGHIVEDRLQIYLQGYFMKRLISSISHANKKSFGGGFLDGEIRV